MNPPGKPESKMLPPPPKFGSGAPPPPTFSGGPASLPPPAAAAASASAPPPPSFHQAPEPAAPTAPLPAIDERKVSLVSAAAQAAARVAPAQMEKAVAEAVRRERVARAADRQQEGPGGGGQPREDQQGSEEGGEGGEGASGRPPGTYEAPEWAGLPEPGHDFSLDVLKGGSLLESVALKGKDKFTFGRSPTADVITEHPSCSRLHCVLQFKEGTTEVFVYDTGSTHGTHVNKRRLKGHAFFPLRVGDQLRLGQSSRVYVLNGPQDLMPAEGISRREAEAALLKKKLAAATAGGTMSDNDDGSGYVPPPGFLPVRGHEVTWGMAEDAVDVSGGAGFLAVGAGGVGGAGRGGGLEGLPADWREYVARGNKLTDKQDKLRDKVTKKEYKLKKTTEEVGRLRAKDKKGELSDGAAKQLATLEKALERLEEELEEADEALNESVRRSLGAKTDAAAAAAGGAAAKRKKGSDDEDGGAVSDEDEFYDLTAGKKLKKRKGGSGSGGGEQGGGKGPEKVETMDSLCGRQEALRAEIRRLREDLLREEALVSDSAAPDAAVDELDAYDAYLRTAVEKDKVASLRREISEVEAELAAVTRLLDRVDPTGAFRPSKEDLDEARRKEEKSRQIEKLRKEAAERRKAEEEARRRRAEKLAKEEAEEQEAAAQAQGHRQEGAGPATAPLRPDDGSAAGALPGPASHGRGHAPEEEVGGLVVRRRPDAPQPQAAASGPSGFLAPGADRSGLRERAERERAARESASRAGEDASADESVTDLLAALQRAKRGAAAVDEGGEDTQLQGWRPPEGQRGDGQTELNKKLGY